MANEKKDDIDYTAEGSTPPREKNDPTNVNGVRQQGERFKKRVIRA